MKAGCHTGMPLFHAGFCTLAMRRVSLPLQERALGTDHASILNRMSASQKAIEVAYVG